MDERISEALRGSQGHHPAPPVPTPAELDGHLRRRRLRHASLVGAALVVLFLLLPGDPEPPASRAVRDAAVAEALGEVLDDLDLLARGPDDDDFIVTQVAMLDPYDADTGLLIDPLNLDGEL